MTLLRLLAFEPATGPSGETERTTGSGSRRPLAQATAPEAVATTRPQAAEVRSPEIGDWPTFVAGMKLSGIALQLAAQTELKAVAGNEIVLAVPEQSSHLTDKAYADKLKVALEDALGRRVRVRFETGGAASATLAAQEKRERAAAQAKTDTAFRDDPFVQDVLARFDAKVKPDSVKPTE